MGFWQQGPFLADVQLGALQSSWNTCSHDLGSAGFRKGNGSCSTQHIPPLFQKPDVEEPDSANSSFYSTQSALASQAGPTTTSSTHSLARLGSPDDGNSALLSLPGYRPTTRSSARRSQARVSSGAPAGEGTVLTLTPPKGYTRSRSQRRERTSFYKPQESSW